MARFPAKEKCRVGGEENSAVTRLRWPRGNPTSLGARKDLLCQKRTNPGEGQFTAYSKEEASSFLRSKEENRDGQLSERASFKFGRGLNGRGPGGSYHYQRKSADGGLNLSDRSGREGAGKAAFTRRWGLLGRL